MVAKKKKNLKRGEPAIPESLNTPEFTAAWADWLKFAAKRGIELSADDASRQLALLAKMGLEEAIADICRTMDNHPLKDRGAEERKVAKGKAKPVPGGKTPADAKTNQDKKLTKKKAPKEPKAKKMSALDAAATVLEEKGEAMNCQEMIDVMQAKNHWTSPNGLTPQATLYSAITREIKTKGDKARFKKADRGQFALR